MPDDSALRECDESRGTRYSERHSAQNGLRAGRPAGPSCSRPSGCDTGIPLRDPLPADLASLTERELDVTRLIAHGLTNAEIATRLFLGETTVKSHVTSILAKLGARDRVQVVVRCYEAGLIRPGRST
jgi:DNA-binding NarL/FixJ family response regulator